MDNPIKILTIFNRLTIYDKIKYMKKYQKVLIKIVSEKDISNISIGGDKEKNRNSVEDKKQEEKEKDDDNLLEIKSKLIKEEEDKHIKK